MLDDAKLQKEISWTEAMDTLRFKRSSTNIFRIIILLTSLCSVFFLFLRQFYKNKWFLMF